MIAENVELGRYRLERLLGQGGMALVYLAHDRAGRPVAVKVLADNLAADADLRSRFLREATLAERLSHPNVVRVLEHGEANGRPYIVLEYVAGPTLAELLRRRGTLPAGEAAAAGGQAAAGLAHAHEAGLVHRDVKPQNLLFADDGTLKVADFGIARAVEGTRLTEIGTILGTAAYLAPEQAAGEETTAAVDVYALGVVLYELLTGRTPYGAETLTELVLRQRAEPPLPPHRLAPDVSPGLEELVLACLAPEPHHRPTAAELERALAGQGPDALTRVLPRPSETPTRIGRRPRPKRRTRVALGALGTALAAALALALGIALSAGSPGTPVRSPPPRIAPIPRGATPAGQARNLARWLRAHSR